MRNAENQVVKALRAACEKAGSQSAWAKANKVSLAYVNDVLRGRREPGPSICDALGFVRVLSFKAKS